jgi:hypothetical protein
VEHSEGALNRENIESLEAGGDIGKFEAESHISGKASTSGGHEVTKHGKHRNTTVLILNKSKAVEALLISVSKDVKRVPEAERGLGTKLLTESHLQRRALSNRSRPRGKSNNTQKSG